jgi:nitrite reductase (NADH) small subunit
MPDIFVSKADDLKEGERKIISHGAQEIGVIRANGALYAYTNLCPHQGGPACEGLLVHKVEEIIAEDKTYRGMRFNEDILHIVCPWHGWEFDIATGRCAGDGKFGLRKHNAFERDGVVYVTV